MSRTKSLLLAAVPVAMALIIAITIIKSGVIGTKPFAEGYQGDVAAQIKQSIRENGLRIAPGLMKYEAEGIERAWREGAIRFEDNLSAGGPLVIHLDFPFRMHQSDMEPIVALYMREKMPGSIFRCVVHHYQSLRPLYAIYADPDGEIKTFQLDARYGMDWAYLTVGMVMIAGCLTGWLVYRLCRRRES